MSIQETLYKTMDEMLSSADVSDIPLIDLVMEIQDLYLLDDKPWVIGFSGGKDSTTILSLIYVAVEKLEPEKRHKHIYVVSSDTLVETPMVVDMVNGAVEQINLHATAHNLPISAHVVTPKMNQTFWSNLLGKGYPAPTQNFLWCTERMKIDPVSEYLLDKVARFGEVIDVLGERKEEGSSRKANNAGEENRDENKHALRQI